MRKLFAIFLLFFLSPPSLALADQNSLFSYSCAAPNETDRFGNPLSRAKFANGKCLPSKTTQFDQTGRMTMYVRCRSLKGGADEYTVNCCDHIRDADGYDFKVCRGATEPQTGLGLILQGQSIVTKAQWVCSAIDCSLIGSLTGLSWLR